MKKKIMLAIGHKIFEEKLIELLKSNYDFTGTAPYREAIVSEAKKYEPDIIVIRESLDGTANMTDIVYALKNEVPAARIVFITTTREIGDEFLATLISYGVYDLMIGTQVKITKLVELINTPNTFSQVSAYAAQVTVDEKGNKKVFETKIIQAPASPQGEAPVKQNKIIPLLPTPIKKKEPVIETIDEAIPLTFIKNNKIDEPMGELKYSEEPKPVKDLKYSDEFYSPNDYLTKTSKPVKMAETPNLVKEEFVVKNGVNTKVLKDAEFDFLIIDEMGAPIVETKEAKGKVEPVVEKVVEPIPVEVAEIKPEPLPIQEKPIIPVVIKEEVKPIKSEPPVVGEKKLVDNNSKPVEKPVTPKHEPVKEIKPQVDEKIQKSNDIYEEEDDDVFNVKPQPVQVKKIEPEKKPIVEVVLPKAEVTEVKKEVATESKVEAPKPFKKNKFLNGYPIPEHTKVLLFVRTEAFSENHTALNVAIKLAKDNKKVYFVENSKDSSYDYFANALVSLQNNLKHLKINEPANIYDVLDELNQSPFDYLIVDTYMDDNLEPFLFMNGKRFVLLKQNKPWIQNAFKSTARLSMFAKYSMLVIEEYTESGMSPKVIMSDLQPFGVLKLKDKKETNFFSLNAKNPAMLTKKNNDTLDAYKDLLDYVYDREVINNE